MANLRLLKLPVGEPTNKTALAVMHRCHGLSTPFRVFDANRSEGLKILGNLPINQAWQV